MRHHGFSRDSARLVAARRFGSARGIGDDVGPKDALMAASGSALPNERLSPAARTLLQLLRLEGDSVAAVPMHDLSATAWEEMLALALSHGVAPLLCRALQRSSSPAGIPDHLRRRLAEERRAADSSHVVGN